MRSAGSRPPECPFSRAGSAGLHTRGVIGAHRCATPEGLPGVPDVAVVPQRAERLEQRANWRDAWPSGIGLTVLIESRARFYCDPTRHSPPTWAFIAYRRYSYGPGALLRRIRATRLCQGGVHMGILLERAFSVTFASLRGAQNGARSSRLGEPSGSKGQLEHLLLRSLSSSKGSIHSPPTGTEEVGRQMRDVGLPQRLRVRRSKGAVKLRLSRRPVPTVTGTKVSLLGSTRRRAGA